MIPATPSNLRRAARSLRLSRLMCAIALTFGGCDCGGESDDDCADRSCTAADAATVPDAIVPDAAPVDAADPADAPSYDPVCASRLAARPPDSRIGTSAVVLDPSFTEGDRATFCAGSEGVLVDIGPAGTRLTGPGCRGRLAREAFRFGVCSCDGIRTTGSLQAQGRGAVSSPVAANGAVAADSVEVSQLVAGGCGGIDVSQTLRVAGSVQTNGLVASNGAEVGRDLIAGDGVRGDAAVSRDAYLAPGAVVDGELVVGGTRFDDFSVDVPPPCVCDPSFASDIPAIATQAGAAADEVHSSASSSLTFSCGRHLWDAETFPQTARIEGRVAITVVGDMVTSGGARLELAPGASLVLIVHGSMRHSGGSYTVALGAGATIDAFIGESISLQGGAVAFGDETQPEASHWYVGGDEVTLGGGAVEFVGGFYAPSAPVRTAGGTVFVTGSLVAADVDTGAGGLLVEYADALADIGECDMPDEPCASCADCASDAACIDGSCGACVGDGDCCGPLVCREGACVPYLI